MDVPEEIYTKQQLLEFLKYHFQKDKSDNIVLSEYKSERKTISESSKSNVKSQAKENSRYGNSMEKQSDSHSISVYDRNEKLADNSLDNLNLADETEVSKKSHELKETSDIKENASKNIDEPKEPESTKGITLKNISYQYKSKIPEKKICHKRYFTCHRTWRICGDYRSYGFRKVYFNSAF